MVLGEDESFTSLPHLLDAREEMREMSEMSEMSRIKCDKKENMCDM